MTNSSLSTVELSAGAGGFALGLERAGLVPALLLATDRDSIATLRNNRPEWVSEHGNPNNLELPRADVLVADLHSDSVSEASGNPRRLALSQQLDDVVAAAARTDARAIIVQGVRSIASSRFRADLEEFRHSLGERRYATDWRVVNASQYGVPQLRPRFMLVALRQDTFRRFDWPPPSAVVPSLGSTLLPLMGEEGWVGASDWAKAATGLAPTIIGGSRRHGGADLGPTRSKQAWLGLGIDPRGVAISAPDAGTPKSVLPRLTNEMLAAIQGFPSDWAFSGSRTSVFRQVARSTPPPVAEAIGTAIALALKN